MNDDRAIHTAVAGARVTHRTRETCGAQHPFYYLAGRRKLPLCWTFWSWP